MAVVSRPYNPWIDGEIGIVGRKGNRGPIYSAMSPRPVTPTMEQFDQRFMGAPPVKRPTPLPQGPAPRPIASKMGGFLGSDAALGLSAGILEGGTSGEALGRGFKYALEARAAQNENAAELAAKQQEANATAQYLRQAGASPELIQLAESGYGGDALKLLKAELEGGDTIINTGNTDAEELRKKLSGKEGEILSTYLEQGTIGVGMMQDMEIIGELADVAPQGAITGRLATWFPGVSTAGDAFNSVVFKLAPSLRTPGSGQTSDIEYEGFLKSVPRLLNTPGANKIIAGVIRNKAKIMVDRMEAVTQYQNGDIQERDLRMKLQEINSRSILPPEMKTVIDREYAPPAGTTSGGIEWSIDE